MKNYNIPTLDVLVLNDEDIITTSGGGEWELPPIEFGDNKYDPNNTDNG